MEVEKEEIEIGYFAEEIKLMKDKVLEKNLSTKELKNIDKELITKITDICFENILKTYKGRNKVNAALLYLKDLYDKNYISEDIEVIYNCKRIRFSLVCTNLSNNQTYLNSTQSGLSSYITQYGIRGRSVLMKMRFKIL